MKLPRPFSAVRSCSSVFRSAPLFLAAGQVHGWPENSGRALHALAVGVLPAMFLLRSTREEIYNILWALVFGFATLNILSLGARRFEQEKSGLNFGEVLAILVVVVSIVLLGWEMLYLFHILPIRLTPS
ncbi:MAG: hypothetical protein ACHP9V_04845 [Terriglobales bacterium]